MKFSVAIQLAAICALVAAHPGGHKRMAANELHKRQIAARERNLLARNCAPAIAEFQASRKARRSLKKRQETVASSTASAASPHVTSIQNFTCVTAPEVTEGPYYINNELVRADLTETQPGVKLILDIGVIDVTTCEPLNDAFVEIWSGEHASQHLIVPI
ncbi:hypothetical protein NLI96_g13263 [Meripilus lineatus]|uniref:Intradiol ring-cleavage dioxygenases domain-containing protein n=1 Tax=Meripilus lineatus TaxID=2056292 RepID=A0AAD5USA7_9APHY|nr:hypothetical protein NLI96_g13263 [Physisporinus lineatus]